MAKAKITVRGHQEAETLRSQTVREINRLKREGDYSAAVALENELKTWEAKYFEKLEKVFISFMCGYRCFYREAYKIGGTLFCNGEKVTKSNGFRAVEIIPEITEKMTAEMIADSYYY